MRSRRSRLKSPLRQLRRLDIALAPWVMSGRRPRASASLQDAPARGALNSRSGSYAAPLSMIAGGDEAAPARETVRLFFAAAAAVASALIRETDTVRAMDDPLTGDAVSLVNVVIPVVEAATDSTEEDREEQELLEILDHGGSDLLDGSKG
jgi:hypothetical protein